jgi:hypothetical protein
MVTRISTGSPVEASRGDCRAVIEIEAAARLGASQSQAE